MVKNTVVGKNSGNAPAKKTTGKNAVGPIAVKPTEVAPAAGVVTEFSKEEVIGDNWPAWKVELLDMLDQHTQVPLVKQLKDGVLKEDISLFLNLNLSTQWVQSKAFPFNQLIKKHSTAKMPLKFVSTDELSECDTLAQLLKLIGSRM